MSGTLVLDYLCGQTPICREVKVKVRRHLVVAFVFVFAVATLASAGTITGKVEGTTGNAVVWIDAIPGKTFPAPPAPYNMDQRGLVFQPHLLIVPEGATVKFANDDTVAHNVYWPNIGGDKKAAHNLGTWPQGQSKEWKVEHAGVVPLRCNVHPEMSAYIVVAPTPFYAQTDNQGNFRIMNVPDGTYKISAWKEGGKTVTRSVTVSGQTKVDFAGN